MYNDITDADVLSTAIWTCYTVLKRAVTLHLTLLFIYRLWNHFGFRI